MDAGSEAEASHHDAVLHGAGVFQRLDHLRDGGALLAYGDIDANDVAAFLIDDGVERDGGLAGLAISNDQLALAAADGDHGVDGLDAGLQRLFHRPAIHHAGRRALDSIELRGGDGALVVDRLAQRVDHAPDHGFADRHRHDAAGAAHLVAFLDFNGIAQQHGAHLILFQVHGDARDAMREFDQFPGHHFFQAVYAGDAVADRDHRSDFGDVDRAFVVFNLLAEKSCNFVRSNLSHKTSLISVIRRHSDSRRFPSASSWPRTEPS
jgi:hypothetical protein